MSASITSFQDPTEQETKSFGRAKVIARRLNAAARLDKEPIMDLVFAAGIFSAALLSTRAPSLAEAKRALEQINLVADAQLDDMWDRSRP